MLSDYAPLPETNTSVTIQNTVFNAPVNLVINVNGASGERSAAQIAEDTRAAVRLSLRDLLGSGGMGTGVNPAKDCPPAMRLGTQDPEIRKDFITVSESRGSHHGKEFVMRSGTTKSYVGKEVVMGPETNGSDFGKGAPMESRTDDLHLGKEVVMGSRATQSHLGHADPKRDPTGDFLAFPPPLPPKTPLPSPGGPAAAPSQTRLCYPAGLSHYAKLNGRYMTKGPSSNVLENVFELPAEPR